MRSSPDDAKLFFSHLKQNSSFVRVTVSAGKVSAVSIDGRIEEEDLGSFRVRGRGCIVQVDLTGSDFEYTEPRELPEGDLRTATERMFESLWTVCLPKESGLLTIAPLLGFVA